MTQKKIWEAKGRWPQAATALDAWFRIAKAASLKSFADTKALFSTVDKVDRFHVFNVGGNKVRLIADVHYNTGKIFIHRIMDHAEYDKGTWKD